MTEYYKLPHRWDANKSGNMDEILIVWWDRDVLFRSSVVRLVRKASLPQRLRFKLASTENGARSAFDAGVHCFIQDVSTTPAGSRDRLDVLAHVSAAAPNCKLIVLSDDITFAEAEEAHRLRAIALPKKGLLTAIKRLAQVITRERAPSEQPALRVVESPVDPHTRMLEQIERMRGSYGHHIERLEQLALERALATSATLAEACARLGWKRSTLATRMVKRGLVFARRVDRAQLTST